MKPIQNCYVENCIPTPASCVEWNGGEIELLDICDGDPMTKVIWEVVEKLKLLAGNDLSEYDMSNLVAICNQKLPIDTNIITILDFIGENQICLKKYITDLKEELSSRSSEGNVDVNLKCFASTDNIGNALSLSRDNFDQLLINETCNHKGRIEGLEIKVKTIQDDFNDKPLASYDEPSFPICTDPIIQSTSANVKSLAKTVCDEIESVGNPNNIASALSKTPANWNTKFKTIQGWDLTPAQWAENYGNLLLVVANLVNDVAEIKSTCCNTSCESIKIGFTATMNDSDDGVIISFTSGAGTKIPQGFIDQGSTGTATDADGNKEDFIIPVSQGGQQDVILTSLDLTRSINIELNTILSNGTITCDKCLQKTIKVSSTCCEITNISNSPVTIFYKTPVTT